MSADKRFYYKECIIYIVCTICCLQFQRIDVFFISLFIIIFVVSNTRKLKNLSNGDKVWLLRDLDTTLKVEIAKKYDVNVSTISRIVSKRSSLETQSEMSKIKRQHSAEHPDLEQCL